MLAEESHEPTETFSAEPQIGIYPYPVKAFVSSLVMEIVR
jgi:hypothetical protein